MAAQSRKSILGDQYGASTANIAAEIAADTSIPTGGFQDPPPGIRRGIAQLDEVKFDVFKTGENEGKPYWQASAVIVEPLTHVYTPTSQGQATGDPIVVTTAGMVTRASIDARTMVPLFDTKTKSGKNMGKVTTMADWAKKIAQMMRHLGADTSKIRRVADLEPIAESLTRVCRNRQTPIYVNFTTSVSKAQNVGDADGTFQNWNGTSGLENYEPPTAEAAGAVQDSSAPAASDDEFNAGISDNPDDVTNLDTDTLLASAQLDDGEESTTTAQNELLRRASETSGKTTDEIEAIDGIDWDGVVAIINGTDPDGSPTEAEPPKKGDHFEYKPEIKGVGGKMKKSAKAIECSVETVNATKKTVTLKSTIDGKTLYKDISWDALEEVS